MGVFQVHPRLSGANTPVLDLPLCAVFLKDDARWPWLVLVPRRPGLEEVHDLTAEDAAQLMMEIRAASRALRTLAGIEKVNVGALGNEVRQLHVHVVARHNGDPAWPGPVWGIAGKAAYAPGEAVRLAATLGAVLSAAPP